MALVLRELCKYYVYYVDDYADPRMENYFLIGPPYKVISVLLLYLYFVKKIGPNLMKDRNPFELKIIMLVYNALQVILNSVLAYLGFLMMFQHNFSMSCQPIDYSGSKNAYWEAKLAYYYFLIKLLDLFDTVFFVLRKKNNQISFLHVYHHVCITFSAYILTRYLPGGQGSLLASLNCLVHVVMYFYYLLTCTWPEVKDSIRWKKYITQIQMVQFSILIVHFSRALIAENCTFPKSWLAFGVTQNLFMLILFSDFYIRAYVKNSKKSTK